MKKFRKVISLILCVCLGFSLMAPLTFAENAEDSAAYDQSKTAALELGGIATNYFVNQLVNDVILRCILGFFGNSSVVRDYFEPLDDSNFYPGDSEFLPLDSDSSTWSLGYSSESILPDDFDTAKFNYYRGSYFPLPWNYSNEMHKDDEGNPETLKVRTIVIDDNTGRGAVTFSVLDCIGISNTDVLKIRAALKDDAKKNNIKSINISSSHTHTGIDSQGVWSYPVTAWIINYLADTFWGRMHNMESRSGVNTKFLNKIIEATSKSVVQACENKKEGTLEYTKIDIAGYLHTNTYADELDTNMYKLFFAPSDGSKSTLITSFGCHPEISSYDAQKDTRLSADFIYYMEKLVNKAGSNFIFIQGNVGNNSSDRGKVEDGLDFNRGDGKNDNHKIAMRYGYELAYICLGASMTEDERIALNKRTGDLLGVNDENIVNDGYTVWYEDLDTYEPHPVNAVLNIRSERIQFEVEQNLTRFLLKEGIASNDIAYNKLTGKYYSTTEIGYMQLGDALQVFFSPGELFSELLVGGKGLRWTKGYGSLRDTYGDNVIVFDLMNDAAGYICPDETYSVIDTREIFEQSFLEDFKIKKMFKQMKTWLLLVSMGRHTASTLMKAYAELVKSTEAA